MLVSADTAFVLRDFDPNIFACELFGLAFNVTTAPHRTSAQGAQYGLG